MISTVFSLVRLYIMRQAPTRKRLRPSVYPCMGLISPIGGVCESPEMASLILATDFLSSFDKNFRESFEYLILIDAIRYLQPLYYVIII